MVEEDLRQSPATLLAFPPLQDTGDRRMRRGSQWEYESSNCFSHNHATALHVWLFNTNLHPRVEIYYCWDHSIPHFILSDWNRKSKSTKSCNGRCCSSVHRARWRRSSSWSRRGLPRPAAAIRKLRQRANRRVQAHLMEQCHCYSLCSGAPWPCAQCFCTSHCLESAITKQIAFKANMLHLPLLLSLY
jgi:hypothetical protein